MYSRCVGLRYLPLFSQIPSARLPMKRVSFDNRKRRQIARYFADSSDNLIEDATRAASIRFSESQRPDPVLIDFYAGCLVSADDRRRDGGEEDFSSYPGHYLIATKFIDDKILSLARGAEEVKQIVLFSDGFDTRPYRIKWPRGTSIFHVSSEAVSEIARQKLESVGAKIPRTCQLIHIPSESPDLPTSLQRRGFHGGSPSSWVIQGFLLKSLEQVKEVLFLVSGLASKGSVLLGEIPKWLVDNQTGNKIIGEIFMSYGFAMKTVDLSEIAAECRRSILLDNRYENLVFVAEQLRFSDYQMEEWRREFLRMEDEAEEDGFEDLF